MVLFTYDCVWRRLPMLAGVLRYLSLRISVVSECGISGILLLSDFRFCRLRRCAPLFIGWLLTIIFGSRLIPSVTLLYLFETVDCYCLICESLRSFRISMIRTSPFEYSFFWVVMPSGCFCPLVWPSIGITICKPDLIFFKLTRLLTVPIWVELLLRGSFCNDFLAVWLLSFWSTRTSVPYLDDTYAARDKLPCDADWFSYFLILCFSVLLTTESKPPVCAAFKGD